MMAGISMKTRVLTLVVIISNVLGNVALKQGVDGSGLGPSANAYLGVLVQPFVALGIALLIVWTLARMTLLSRADLSYVLPVTAIGYVLIAVVSRLYLGEAMPPGRWMGTLLITAGFVLVGTTSERTYERKVAREEEPVVEEVS